MGIYLGKLKFMDCSLEKVRGMSSAPSLGFFGTYAIEFTLYPGNGHVLPSLGDPLVLSVDSYETLNKNTFFDQMDLVV